MRRLLGMLLCLLAVLSPALAIHAEEVQLRVVGWNLESGDANPRLLARRVADEEKVDIWGFSEVEGRRVAREMEIAAEVGENSDYKTILGTTGGEDRLAIVYNSARLELEDVEELPRINVGGRVRAPLVATFKGRETGTRFMFMVNHLYRGDADGRHNQATLLNEWARDQTLPVIAVGDYNFDWHYQTGETNHDLGYDNLVKDAVFLWVRPEILIPTNASNHKSVLDFVFVHGDATGWEFESTILAVDGDFPDDARKSDHRPVAAVFRRQEGDELVAGDLSDQVEADADTAEVPSKRDALLERIQELEVELDRLRELIEPATNF